MLISDKQELRRCVKRAVRRAQIAEAALCYDAEGDENGVDALLAAIDAPGGDPDAAMRALCRRMGTPLGQDAAAMFGALSAMGFDTADLGRAREQAAAYTPEAYIRQILDAMRASAVFAHVPVGQVHAPAFDDSRMQAVLVADEALFAPGRYGVDYREAARLLADALAQCGAGHVTLEHYDAQAVRYALLPLCQDIGCVLHLHIEGVGELAEFAQMLDAADGVRAVVTTSGAAHGTLIELARTRLRLLPALTDTAYLGQALAKLGTRRFAAYASRARLPEMMLGRWALAKAAIIDALCEAYLPLARAGYPLQSEAVETDVACLMGVNLTLFSGCTAADGDIENEDGTN